MALWLASKLKVKRMRVNIPEDERKKKANTKKIFCNKFVYP
jgi:hypothetical protein